jgi:hypothetical protein
LGLAIGLTAVFIFFSAEHLFNFIGRTRCKFMSQLNGTIVHRPLAMLAPILVLLFLYCAVGT